MELSTTEKVTEKEAAKVCSQLAGKFGNDRQSDLFGSFRQSIIKQRLSAGISDDIKDTVPGSG